VRLARRVIRAKTPLGARKKKDALRKHDEPKIKELPKLEHEIAAIQVAQAASMSLRRRMEERAAFGIKESRPRQPGSCRGTIHRALFWRGGIVLLRADLGTVVRCRCGRG
jgi:anti-sigma-K factor RskA